MTRVKIILYFILKKLITYSWNLQNVKDTKVSDGYATVQSSLHEHYIEDVLYK